MIFDVPVAPLSQNAIYKRGRGKRLYMTEEGKSFKASVLAYALHARLRWERETGIGWQMVGDHGVSLLLRFPTGRGDLDGPIKPILDALQGAVYNNDKQVGELAVKRHLRHPHPGITIEVTIL